MGGRTAWAIRRLASALVPYRLPLLAGFAGMAAVAATEPALVWVVKHLVDEGFGQQPGTALAWLLTMLVLAFALRSAAAFATGYLMLWISSALLCRLQQQVFEAALAADPALEDAQVGQAINAVVAEGRQALDLVERVCEKFFRSVFSVAALAVTLLLVDPLLGTVLMTFIIPFGWVVRVLGKRYEVAANGYVASNSRLAECTEEAMVHADLIRQFGSVEHEARRLDLTGRRVNAAYRRMLGVAGTMVPLTQVIVACYLGLLFWLRPLLSGSLTDGEFVALATTLLLMMVPLRELAEVNGALLRGVVGALTVFAAADLPREPSGSVPFPASAAPAIEFDEVAVAYPGNPAPVLHGLSLRIAPGETVAIVGRCGAGKSTLLGLIAALVRPSHGAVRIDGVSTEELDVRSLRDHIAHVGQDCMLFDDTIACNVSYGANGPDSRRLWQALEGARIAGFVASLALREDTRIGNGGVQLSSGQRQALSVARALYRDAPIVLLDEPTAAMDGVGEAALGESLRALLQGRTVVLVTHREAGLALAHRIFRLEAGRLVPIAAAADAALLAEPA